MATQSETSDILNDSGVSGDMFFSLRNIVSSTIIQKKTPPLSRYEDPCKIVLPFVLSEDEQCPCPRIGLMRKNESRKGYIKEGSPSILIEIH